MAERDDRMAQGGRDAQQGGSQRDGQGDGQGDDQSALDQSLQRGSERLAGDIDSNRNLTGSTTYETLSEQGDLDVAEGGASDRGASDRGTGDRSSGGRESGDRGESGGRR